VGTRNVIPERVAFISITDAICMEDMARCEDRIRGITARRDGIHYEGTGQEAVIDPDASFSRQNGHMRTAINPITAKMVQIIVGHLPLVGLSSPSEPDWVRLHTPDARGAVDGQK
jgi:hypothetical protein